ncbi:MAG: helix-turn-helix domain-containing protein [Planctomycetota bacterium]
MSDYLSFEEVLGELNISEEDLKRMVSEGELRAFREENKMKFRREDVTSLKGGGRPSEPTVVFDGGGDSEGTILDLDSGELPAVPQETAVPELDFGGGEAPPAEEAPSEEGETTGITQEMVFEDSDALKVQPNEDSGGESGETFVDENSDTGAGTEALAVENEPGAAEAATEEGGESAVTEEEAAPRVRGRAAAAEAGVAAEPPKPSAAMTVLVGIAAVLMAMTGYVMVDLIRVMTSDGTPTASDTVQKIRDIVPGKGKPAIEGAQPQ